MFNQLLYTNEERLVYFVLLKAGFLDPYYNYREDEETYCRQNRTVLW